MSQPKQNRANAKPEIVIAYGRRIVAHLAYDFATHNERAKCGTKLRGDTYRATSTANAAKCARCFPRKG